MTIDGETAKDFDDAVVVVETKTVVSPDAVALSQQLNAGGPSEVRSLIKPTGSTAVSATGTVDPNLREVIVTGPYKALVALKDGRGASEQELIEHCKARLAGYKCPKAVEIWDELPKTTVGKILRRDVKRRFWDGAERNIA